MPVRTAAAVSLVDAAFSSICSIKAFPVPLSHTVSIRFHVLRAYLVDAFYTWHDEYLHI
jgi:hypothetical protein